MTTEANRELIREFFANYGEQKIAEVIEVMHDDVQWWINGKPHLYAFSGIKTKADMMAVGKKLTEALPNWMKVEVRSIIADGDRVSVEWSCDGVTNTGKRYQNDFVFIFLIKDGKIVQCREYYDLLHANEVFPELA